jgi:hypothetical protein
MAVRGGEVASTSNHCNAGAGERDGKRVQKLPHHMGKLRRRLVVEEEQQGDGSTAAAALQALMRRR